MSWRTSMAAPSGTIKKPTSFSQPSSADIMAERCFLSRFASCESRAAQQSLPTAVSLARHCPAERKLPESSASPGRLRTLSASPVSSASFTSAAPVHSSASAGTWQPAFSTTMSPSTSSCGGTGVTLPPRTACTGRCSSRAMESSVRFTRSSCTMPMSALITTMPRNSVSRYAPTATQQAAKARNTKLKNVNRLSRTMRPAVFVKGFGASFARPAAARAAASSQDRPYSGRASHSVLPASGLL